MSALLWISEADDDAVDLGDPFHLLTDFAELAHACGEDCQAYPDLFEVPGLTMDGEDVPGETLGAIATQAAAFLRRHGSRLSSPAVTVLSLLAAIRRDGAQPEEEG